MGRVSAVMRDEQSQMIQTRKRARLWENKHQVTHGRLFPCATNAFRHLTSSGLRGRPDTVTVQWQLVPCKMQVYLGYTQQMRTTDKYIYIYIY